MIKINYQRREISIYSSHDIDTNFKLLHEGGILYFSNVRESAT